MKQLTGVDANFLYMETPTSFGHVNSCVVYERPDDPEFNPYEAFRSQLEARLHLLDPFRRRLVQVPLSLDHPYWINDPDFDLDFHVRHIAIPPPGDLEQLSAQIARIIGRPIDRTRPLWEVYVLEGLENDDFAVLTKVHHATIDGASGVEMLSILLDSDVSGDDVPTDPGTWKSESVPSDMTMLARTAATFVQRPGKFARVQLRAIQQLADITRSKGLSNMVATARKQFPTVAGSDRREGQLLSRPRVAAPPTPWNKSITPHRRLVMRSTQLADVKALKTALGVTVNDVVMSISAGALRNYLLKHDALPDGPLRAMVPVSIRTGDEDDLWTNRVSGLVAELPTDEADPLERVARVHQSMVDAKAQFEMVPADALAEMAQFAPPALAVQASRVASSLRIADRANSPINVVISNVPGPREPLYMGGARMKHFYPVSTIAEGVGLNITVQSYLGGMDFGLVACRELMPDLEELLDMHMEEIEVLFEAAGLERSPGEAAPGAVKAAPKKKAPAKKRAPATSTKETSTKKATTKKAATKKK